MFQKIFFLFLIFSLKPLSCSQEIAMYKPNTGEVIQTVTTDNPAGHKTSLHFLLATIGRKSIFNILDSLKNQLQPQDFLTIVYDAKDVDTTIETVREFTHTFPCSVTIIMEKDNLGFWGHGIRNKYAILEGDFVLHCDDDNIYEPDSLSTIRKICLNKNALYIFKIFLKNKRSTIWKEPILKRKNLDTGSGVIPTCHNHKAEWLLKYGGDYQFYHKLGEAIGKENILFVDYIIYSWRP